MPYNFQQPRVHPAAASAHSVHATVAPSAEASALLSPWHSALPPQLPLHPAAVYDIQQLLSSIPKHPPSKHTSAATSPPPTLPYPTPPDPTTPPLGAQNQTETLQREAGGLGGRGEGGFKILELWHC